MDGFYKRVLVFHTGSLGVDCTDPPQVYMDRQHRVFRDLQLPVLVLSESQARCQSTIAREADCWYNGPK
jgi:hypothetical protein